MVRRGIVAGLAFWIAVAAPAQDHQHPAGPPETLDGWARGAMLFDGLGNFHRAVTTRSPQAQAYFDQGMRFLWAFNHDEATRSFAKGAMLDPACAMCLWGVALTLGPNYNMPMMTGARAIVGQAALRAAQAIPDARPVERALIAAVATRYAGSTALDAGNIGPVLTAYADAMREVAAAYPADADVQVLFAEALMTANPWKLWTADGQPAAGTPEILATLERTLAASPAHPGANHYWIHAVEASRHPERALPSAERLVGMMPAAGHMEHMPAHIMQRVGRYEEAAEANRKGAAADLAYLKQTAPPDYYPMYLIHNYQFLASAAAMEGRRAEAIEAARAVRSLATDAMLTAMPGYDWQATCLFDVYVRFGLWAEMLAAPAPAAQLPGATINYHQSRAVALAALGRASEAKAELATAATLIAATPPDAVQAMNRAIDLYRIGQLRAEARIAGAERGPAAAVPVLRRAIAIEDKLAYDEPQDEFFPTRHLLGAALLASGDKTGAARIFEEDLARNPANGWALYGLAVARGAGTESALATAWAKADTKLTSSAF
ncbi:hypothetical protein [Sphingomonas sp.]|uniref:hypothetical protein n=1 Tax=Sphingomonas sp. TaxID=28214 RepID=UPI000DB7653E|nr:hypothetical protein [Sphingomonas sp.]PZU11860.1 MAG: hypothetical protein DI605_02575 [Sphingomonas sp.]